MRSVPLTGATRTRRGRLTKRHQRSGTARVITSPRLVTPVRPGSGTSATRGISRPGITVEHPECDQGDQPGARPPRQRPHPGGERHLPPAQPGDQVKDAGEHRQQQRAERELDQPPPRHAAAQEEHRIAARLDRRGHVELHDRRRDRRPDPPQPGAVEAGRRVGGPVQRPSVGHGQRRHAAVQQLPLLLRGVGHRISAQLVVGAGHAGFAWVVRCSSSRTVATAVGDVPRGTAGRSRSWSRPSAAEPTEAITIAVDDLACLRPVAGEVGRRPGRRSCRRRSRRAPPRAAAAADRAGGRARRGLRCRRRSRRCGRRGGRSRPRSRRAVPPACRRSRSPSDRVRLPGQVGRELHRLAGSGRRGAACGPSSRAAASSPGVPGAQQPVVAAGGDELPGLGDDRAATDRDRLHRLRRHRDVAKRPGRPARSGISDTIRSSRYSGHDTSECRRRGCVGGSPRRRRL